MDLSNENVNAEVEGSSFITSSSSEECEIEEELSMSLVMPEKPERKFT